MHSFDKGLAYGVAIATGISLAIDFFGDSNQKNVQEGYVVPMLDGNGKPVLRDYKINPSSGSSRIEILAEKE